jgi:hypothetical protein
MATALRRTGPCIGPTQPRARAPRRPPSLVRPGTLRSCSCLGRRACAHCRFQRRAARVPVQSSWWWRVQCPGQHSLGGPGRQAQRPVSPASSAPGFHSLAGRFLFLQTFQLLRCCESCNSAHRLKLAAVLLQGKGCERSRVNPGPGLLCTSTVTWRFAPSTRSWPSAALRLPRLMHVWQSTPLV